MKEKVNIDCACLRLVLLSDAHVKKKINIFFYLLLFSVVSLNPSRWVIPTFHKTIIWASVEFTPLSRLTNVTCEDGFKYKLQHFPFRILYFHASSIDPCHLLSIGGRNSHRLARVLLSDVLTT